MKKIVLSMLLISTSGFAGDFIRINQGDIKNVNILPVKTFPNEGESSFAIDDPKTNFRNFCDLKLERESSPIFSLSWTIAHDIDESSPLYGLTMEDWRRGNAELVVTFSGTDTTLSQQVYAKSSYIANEVLFDHDFVDVLKRNEEGKLEFMVEKFDLVKSTLKQIEG